MASETPDLPDNQLIQEGKGKSPLPLWLYFALMVVLLGILWGGRGYFMEMQQEKVASKQFLQVTNRDFSLFLWQFPEYMRANMSFKAGYLPDFEYGEKMSIVPGKAEDYVSAPPNVIFLYHVWKRLIGEDVPKRVVPLDEFKDFLEACPEWKPENWTLAPKEYNVKDLPKQVLQAFIGWKNFFLEKEAINQMKITYGDMEKFLKQYPHYARNYWRNILINDKPDYLKSLFLDQFKADDVIPNSEIAAFARVAYFNYTQSLAGN